MKIMCKVVLTFALVLGLFSLAHAQPLATGESGGKGNSAILLSANGLYPEGLTLTNIYFNYIYGLTDRIDLSAIYGNISAMGEGQHYIGFGWNANLVKRSKAFVDVSFFNTVTVPLNRRNEASKVLMTPALVVSRPVKITGHSLTLYSGLNYLVPIGSVEAKLFTPPETLFNVPIGVSIPLDDKWIFSGEADLGPNLKALGIAIIRTF